MLSQSVGASSFVQRDEYFKGVPIYIVQVQESSTTKSSMLNNYFKLLALLIVFGQIVHAIF